MIYSMDQGQLDKLGKYATYDLEKNFGKPQIVNWYFATKLNHSTKPSYKLL